MRGSRGARSVQGCVAALLFWLSASSSAWASGPDGLYLMTRFMGGMLEMKAWYFEADTFALEPRAASKPFDFDEAERLAPGSTGRLERKGGRWTFHWKNGPSRPGRHESGSGPGGCFYWDAGLFCPVQAFRPGQVLDGAYTGSLGSARVGSSRTYVFTPDGRYRMSSSASVVSTGPTVSMYGGATNRQEGRYRLQGHLIVLSPDQGPEVTFSAFPFEPTADASKPGRVYVGGFMLKRTGP